MPAEVNGRSGLGLFQKLDRTLDESGSVGCREAIDLRRYRQTDHKTMKMRTIAPSTAPMITPIGILCDPDDPGGGGGWELVGGGLSDVRAFVVREFTGRVIIFPSEVRVVIDARSSLVVADRASSEVVVVVVELELELELAVEVPVDRLGREFGDVSEGGATTVGVWGGLLVVGGVMLWLGVNWM
jgi:hypothetical protein